MNKNQIITSNICLTDRKRIEPIYKKTTIENMKKYVRE